MTEEEDHLAPLVAYLQRRTQRANVWDLDPVAIATGCLGIKEATGHNDGLPDLFFNRALADGSAWCACFLLAIYEVCATRPPLHDSSKEFFLYRKVSNLEEGMVRKGWHFGKYIRPKRNDIIFLSRDGGSGHAALVVDTGVDRIFTIEGNLSNSVASTSHDRTSPRIRLYARPGGDW